MIDTIKALHDSEINGAIEWFYDNCWTARLGDELHGWDSEATCGSLEEAVEWLREETVRRYPDSEFAKKHGREFA